MFFLPCDSVHPYLLYRTQLEMVHSKSFFILSLPFPITDTNIKIDLGRKRYHYIIAIENQKKA